MRESGARPRGLQSAVTTPGSTSGSHGLHSSASLPHLPGTAEQLLTLSDELSHYRVPKARSRVFAAHAHDTQRLQQMVTVLMQRAGRPQGRERSITSAGLIEEGQLYAVCMQELAAQVAVHSPLLSEMSGQLFHGFVSLFKKSVGHQEARLGRERDGEWERPSEGLMALRRPAVHTCRARRRACCRVCRRACFAGSPPRPTDRGIVRAWTTRQRTRRPVRRCGRR